jgi:alkanesulfonate monooxygenase SsuD/methylene tetrahydromethanopterin reductase-like flavin-dependent oxidoreductase (luciferase family)/hemerythrin-like domain-containing protein
MTDYRQQLQFGTFLTPSADRPDRLIQLALLTESVALDLATVQDHPYQARHLDAWAVLAIVLARTNTLRVTTNVTNLPLRPPFGLAKTVATLDLLSGGRVELGLGAGAFWDAIEAAGGPRRSPGEALAALEEGIGIIRGMWDISRRSLRTHGQHYAVRGVHPGPAPVHDVEIWVGAAGPRALALTGRLSDGWLPSMAYVEPETLAERNARIDEAAVAADRDPADIRRLYNVHPAAGGGGPGLVGDPADWAEQLAELTLTFGMSSFILASDDPALIQAFGEDVAPSTRNLVDVERRSESGPSGPDPFTATEGPVTLSAGAPATSAGVPPEPTPDDGTRRSTRTVWDDAARPTYQSGDPPIAWTPHQRAAAQHLVEVHNYLRAELARLYEVLEQVAGGALEPAAARSLVNTMVMRQNNWTLGTFCESYCRLVTTHHTIEDTSMFPHLRSRDPDLSPVIDRLEEEHHAIAGVLDGVDRALVELVAAGAGEEADHALSALRGAVDLVDDTMRSHLAWEESVLMEPLARFEFSS